MTASIRPWRPRVLGPTEPRHDTEDPAWLPANRYLRDHPEYQAISAAVLSAFIAGNRVHRDDLLRWVEQARACLADQQLDGVELCLQEIEEYAGRGKK